MAAKDGNPKDEIGRQKPSISFVPMAPLLVIAEVMRGGAAKYGIKNYREQPVSASTYIDAMFRHMVEWFDLQQDQDDESKLSHLAHIAACALILMDAQARNTLMDNRGLTEVKRPA